MHIMKKLLANLGDTWNTLPKDIPLLTIQKGTGTHSMVTVEHGTLNFHSVPFRSDLPVKQVIELQNMTAQDLISTMNGMGYVSSLSSEAQYAGLSTMKAYILLDTENVLLGTTLSCFTSTVWKTLFPIYRVLQDAEENIDLALKQLYRDIASGYWLDFWADFFSIKRATGESDNDFVRRFTMWLFNPKTNNIALKELLSYQLKDTNIDVKDKQAMQFEVLVGTKYLADASALHKILIQAKGAGIEYFLNYQSDVYSEDYRAYLSDATGQPFETLDVLLSLAIQNTYTETYPIPSEALMGMSASTIYAEDYTSVMVQSNIDGCFTLNSSLLNQDELYTGNGSSSPNDIATITLTVGGSVVWSSAV